MLKHASIVLLACLMPWSLLAKCGNSVITIKGLISGPVAGSTVSAEVVPDPNWNSQPTTVIDTDGQFHMTVYFDRTEPRRRERCSRKPETVILQLHRNGKLVDQVTLQIKRDFVSKDNTDFSVRAPITLHSH